MPVNRVDFYVLESGQSRMDFACLLAEKAYLKKHRVLLHCDNVNQAHQIDDALWLFKKDSFIPHNIVGEGPNQPPPIQISYTDKQTHHRDILLNLSNHIPEYHQQFRRVIEIVDQSDSLKAQLRQHYRFYQSQGYPIHSHIMTTT